jgi:RHS repeat-associated protein
MSCDLGATGQQRETELYFMQSRFYDPEIGRFIQPDSMVPDPDWVSKIVIKC